MDKSTLFRESTDKVEFAPPPNLGNPETYNLFVNKF